MKQFPEGVNISNGILLYSDWNALVQKNFKKYFYIPKASAEDKHCVIDSKLVNRRGIYKDSFRSSRKYTDYQLRPNFLIAMCVAPELFDHSTAVYALKMTREILVGPLGMKTLDPIDYQYRGNYVNSNDSNDYFVARGFNYHNGPEWLWVTGYFLRAYYFFGRLNDTVDCSLVHFILGVLNEHKKYLMQTNIYAGLPELTNMNGVLCPDSCPTQAWSMATILDLLYDLRDEVLTCVKPE
jgi:glycogen debranching enzyme